MNALKQKAMFTAGVRLLSNITAFLTHMLVTPLILHGLGQYVYGIFSMINKAESYMSFVDLRPTAILRYKLSLLQHSGELDEKRKYIGASVYMSLIIFPVILFAGVILCYFFPFIFNISKEYIPLSRTAVFIVAVLLGIKSFLGIPEAILRGNNLEYKGAFIEPARNVLYGLLVYVTLNLHYGILGILAASLASYLFGFILKYIVRVRYLPNQRYLKPQKKHIQEMANRGSWYLLSSFAFQILQAIDILVIGIFFNPITVTIFTLTKSLSFRVSESLAFLSGSISSGLGELIGKKDLDAVRSIRIKVIRLNLILGATLFLYFTLFNAAFINLWVGEENYAGTAINLVISLTVPLILLSMSAQLFVDASLKFKEKSLTVAIASVLSLSTAIILQDKFGLLGIAIGILIGRIWLWISFELIINRIMPLSFWTAKSLRGNVSLAFFMAFVTIGSFLTDPIPAETWFELIWKSFVFFSVLSISVYFLVINKAERAGVRANFIKRLE